MLSVGFNPGMLGANLAPDNEEYLKARKRRRSTVGNIWQLKAVLNEEVIDDQEFVAASIAAEKTSRKNSSIKSSLRSLSIMEDEEDKEDKENSEEDRETGKEEEKIDAEFLVGSNTSAKDLYTEKELPLYTIHL